MFLNVILSFTPLETDLIMVARNFYVNSSSDLELQMNNIVLLHSNILTKH